MWVEVICSIGRVWSSNECACCACDPSVHISVPLIVFLKYFFWKAGSQVFALLMLFLCVIWHTMWSVKSVKLLCILPFVCCACLPSV